MTPRVPSHQALQASVEAAIGRRMRLLRAHLVFQGSGARTTDHAMGADPRFEECEWLFDDRSWQCGGHEGSVLLNADDRWLGDTAFALLRLLELRERLQKMDSWPAKEA